MSTITLTPAQLTLAQMGKEVTLNRGVRMSAIRLRDGWKYVVASEEEYLLLKICYAGEGLEEARRALNEEE